ncbi:outer membrane protein assembly factor BamD [Candidatus Symbiobacter mobilis]|uniref:Outer membrane protein assembly factor BamD n=1 Tax=Candidatus Symbiobacter mobilis CR TaxID=946483 RepID=U5NCW6_9BURK|nr:outer membrane protein assembly factor BamD [Candidatus Symbiobacter mobilis]AGX88083.1 DNA uptake lipoprotein [Candidatus Symbiobacter mobilis CR]
MPLGARLSLPSFRAAVAVTCAALVLAACSTVPKDPTANLSLQELYALAREEMDVGAYDKAVPLLEKLEGRAVGTPLAQQAQLDRAYAHHKAGEPLLAVAVLDRFMKQHPASPVLDYALYLKGVVNFQDDLGPFASVTRQDLSERDQKSAKDAFDAFQELVRRFPASRYAADATHRMRYIVNLLAQSEVHVARYYLQRGAYLAAANRAQTAVTDYPGAASTAQALDILVRAYDAMGMTQLRDDARRVLEHNYPQGVPAHTKERPWWKFW